MVSCKNPLAAFWALDIALWAPLFGHASVATPFAGVIIRLVTGNAPITPDKTWVCVVTHHLPSHPSDCAQRSQALARSWPIT